MAPIICSKAKTTYTHTHPFNGPLSGTTQVSRYQKGKTNLDSTGARDSERQWYQLGHMQVCTSLQTDNHASTSLLKFFTGRMPFLPPNRRCQSTEGKKSKDHLLAQYCAKQNRRDVQNLSLRLWTRFPVSCPLTLKLRKISLWYCKQFIRLSHQTAVKNGQIWQKATMQNSEGHHRPL